MAAVIQEARRGLSRRLCNQQSLGTFPIRRNPFPTPTAIPVPAGCLPAPRGRDREESWQTTPVTDPRMAGGGGEAADLWPDASGTAASRLMAGAWRVKRPRGEWDGVCLCGEEVG